MPRKASQTDYLLQKVIAHFRLLRKEQKLSHESLSKKAGISRPALSHIESGRRKPSLMLAIRVAHALGTDLSSILHKAESEMLGE